MKYFIKIAIGFAIVMLCGTALALFTFFQGSTTYSGKIVDAETLEPIEGAVVAIAWYSHGGYSLIERLEGAKETLTDKNGEWALKGPIRRIYWVRDSFWHIVSYIKNVAGRIEIVWFKPGYQSRCYFEAYPHKNSKTGEDGIVLKRNGDIYKKFVKEQRTYNTKPFISVNSPEEKLKKLEFSFTYPDEFQAVTPKRIDGILERYTVRGLKKAITWEEILHSTDVKPPGGKTKTPIFYKIRKDDIRQKFKNRGKK